MATLDPIFLSVVIPSYDEMANLQKGVLDKVEHFLEKQTRSAGSGREFSYEVIVVDDGSKDGSSEFVEQFTKENKNFKLIKNHHTGKAGAVTTGILKAKGQYILFTDMDQATPIEEVDKLLPFFEEGYDIVIGSRKGRKGSPMIRKAVSLAAVVLRKIIVGLNGISDTQCGFKAFKRDVAKQLFERVNEIHKGFRTISGSSVTAGFDMEFLYMAQKMGFKIKEVPVRWLYVETRRVNPVKDSVDGVLDLLKIKIQSLKGYYK
jgi:dolichyl-phosphate beta-glucosyltransferase